HDTIFRLTTLFGAMADNTRARMLLLLLDGEKRSGELAATLTMTPSAVSHQLRWLRDRAIVSARKNGREVYYELADACIREIIEVALIHIHEGVSESA
ncbi:MAG TPA: metalloregulator ArsR/SmtB family transcription factor, partial [Aggregatilineales bacterium]|nr:metalloregulator ArsR/SmtB family transcription factor [Aggregatilineales bacterium]